METFIERLLVGLAHRDLELTIRSRHRPSTAWLSRHGIAWVPGGSRLDREAISRQVRHNGAVDTIRAVTGRIGHRVRRAASGTRPDVVYVPWLNTLVSEPALFALAPVVTSCRGSLVTVAPWDPARPHHRRDLAEVFTRSTLVHCVSEDIVGEAVALGLDPSRARVIHPAVDPEAFRPSSRGRSNREGRLRVIAVGSLKWVKDGEHALRAVRGAIDAGADVGLDIIGGGPEEQHLRYSIDDLDLVDRVEVHGPLPPIEVAAMLREADVLLHTSAAEGVSNAVLEAMATGLPIVTTEAGGLREAVRHGIDGIVTPVRGSSELASALVTLASDPSLRRRLGDAARDRVIASFRLDRQVDAFVDLLGEAVRTGPVR